MSLRDRGKIKWQGAFFMPQHLSMLKEFTNDYYRQEKPILDQYQIDEFDNKICYAMEFTFLLKFTFWDDGFNRDYTGLVHRIDPLEKVIYLERASEDSCLMKIKFADIVNVEVMER